MDVKLLKKKGSIKLNQEKALQCIKICLKLYDKSRKKARMKKIINEDSRDVFFIPFLRFLDFSHSFVHRHFLFNKFSPLNTNN